VAARSVELRDVRNDPDERLTLLLLLWAAIAVLVLWRFSCH